MFRVAAFTGGRDVPGARFRVRQYRSLWRRLGIDLHEYYPRWSAYPPTTKWMRPFWAIGTLAERASDLVASGRCDLSLLQREFVSSMLTLEALARRPRLLDVDDAIWLNSRGRFAERLAGLCEGVICGNQFLAEYFGRFNVNISIVPTAVDTELYIPQSGASDELRIGWMGTASNLKYLQAIEPALKQVLRAVPKARLYVVSNRPPAFKNLPAERVLFEPWGENGEVPALQRMTVGLMPLEDTPWARGKCSFKMLQYMACGVPAVVSPVGMNQEVLKNGGAVAAQTSDEWVGQIVSLLRDDQLRSELGRRARETVVRHYSVEVIGPVLASVFRRFL